VAIPESQCTCTCRNWRRGLTALALIGTLVIATAQPAQAQLVATTVPALTVYGNGEATVPADMATVQILIGLGDRQFGFSQEDSGSSIRESASGSVSSDGDEDSGGRRGNRRAEPETITPEQVDAIVASIAEAAAVQPNAIETHLSPLAARRGEDRARNLRLELIVDQPTPQDLNDLFAAGSDVATENGLVVEVAGARYDTADCAAIEEAAQEAAIADADLRAERLARLLGVALGEVVGAASNDYSIFESGEGGCSGQTGSSYDSEYGGLGISVPVFDPAQPAEVTVISTLTIAYEIVGNDTE
jgi:hypothetical protein